NSEDNLGTPTSKNKFTERLDKISWLENYQEPAASSSSNSQPIRTSIITQVFHVPLEEKRYVNQLEEGTQAKFCLEIMQRTGSNLEITYIKNKGLYITVSGKPEIVAKAQKEIFARFGKQFLTTASIPKENFCSILGKTREKRQDLGQKVTTNIQTLCPVNYTSWINIGTKEVMRKAPCEVLFLSTEQDKYAEERSAVEKAFPSFIAEPYNKTFDKILQKTEAQIHNSPSSADQTQIRFPEKKKAFTEDYVKTKIYTLSSISAPSWLHKFVIGQKGHNISTVTQNMPEVCIEFTGEDKITIKGPTDDVKCAQEQIEVIVKDVINRMDYAEINVDYKFHKYLIGKKGAFINGIKERNKVSVLISPENEKNNLIRIEGESRGVQQAKKELLELASHLENEHKNLTIEQRFHHTIIGQKGERIHDIRKKFPEVVITFLDPAQKSDIVQLTGLKNELEKFTQYLQNVVMDIVESSYSITIPIFKSLHKNIIGKGGANIKKSVQQARLRNIVIKGRPENCKLACDLILSIQKHIGNISEVEISIPSNLHKSLMDPKNCLVDAIMEECGSVHILFPNNSGLQRVIVRGPDQSVEKAKKKLLQLAEEQKSYSVVLRVKPQYHKFLMSKKGGNVPKVCEETGAHFIFPIPEDKDQELITITGTEKAIRDARSKLHTLITNLDNAVEDKIVINPKYHQHYFVQRDQVLQDTPEEYGGVIISFSHSGKQSNKVTIKGARPCVEAAKKYIHEIIEDLDNEVTTECVIPQKFHNFLMGPMCSRVRQITKDYNVQIKFSDREEISLTNKEPAIPENKEEGGKSTARDASISPTKCDTVFISGQKEKCEAAFEALKTLIPVTAEVNVPFDLHRYLTGQKKSRIHKIMDECEVKIQIAAPGLESDIISITGLTGDVERARAKLQEQIKTLQTEIDQPFKNFRLNLTVDPKYHPRIIGRKGSVITQICLEHKVNIHFPRKGSNEIQDQITIIGYKANTLAARDTIMKMVHNFEKSVTMQIPLNNRVYGHIIGFHGKAIHKIMNQFQVDIFFPLRGRSPRSIDHILSLEEHFLAIVPKHELRREHMKKVILCNLLHNPSKSFAGKYVPCTANNIQKIPNMSSSQEFPRLENQVDSETHPWRCSDPKPEIVPANLHNMS
uniref:Vigilin n=1 Tax=Moschus moschiferus TaxID=68415 RepID=A0A8C6DFQ7_MOSMO